MTDFIKKPNTSWYEMLAKTIPLMEDNPKIIAAATEDDKWHTNTPTELQNIPSKILEQLKTPFFSGFGAEEGCAFCIMTEEFVYFPLCYDGSEFIGYAPRIPSKIQACYHQGGG